MKQKTSTAVFVLLVFFLTATQAAVYTNAKPMSVTGHYRLRQGEFRNSVEVLQLPGGKINFQLIALWVSPNYPDNIHNGELQGVVTLDKGVAIFESGTCKITMKFSANKVAITESDPNGECGFGANVTAVGTYRKIDSRRPKFDF